MSLESDYYSNLSKIIASTKFNLPENYLDKLNESLMSLQTIDFNNILKNLPTTRKSTTPTAIKHLKQAHDSENLNLVLGAGISKPYGLPTWDFLLQRLLLKTIEVTPERPPVTPLIVFTKIFEPANNLVKIKDDQEFYNHS